MRRLLVLGGLICIALTLPASQILAQSGVFSGPPQVQRGPGSRGDPSPGGSRPGTVWIAVVGGVAGSSVAVGYSGHQRSRFEAEDAAIRQCNRFARGFACHTPYAVSSGCLYIVWGQRPGGGATWGRAATQQAALSECRRGGYNCSSSNMYGGCVPGYN
jgi:hypothetical protein